MVLNQSRNSLHFMEPKGSLQRLQVPATCPCLEPAHSSPCLHPISWRSILINIKMPRPLKWPLSLRFPHQNPVYTSPIPHMHHMPHPSHSSRFFITWTILGEVYRSLSSSLCSFLQFHVTSSLLGPNRWWKWLLPWKVSELSCSR